MKYEEIVKLPIKKIVWLDAADRTQVKLTEIDDNIKRDINMLVERTTIGWIYKEDKKKIVLVSDVTEDGDLEITIIPKPWVIK